jgi:hypothetical protein
MAQDSEGLMRTIFSDYGNKRFTLNVYELKVEVRIAHNASRNNRNEVWAVGHALCALRTVHEENQA